MAKRTRFTATLTFEIEGVYDSLSAEELRDLREFINDALESCGGQRHRDDWLFGSLEKVRAIGIKRVHP